MNTKNGCIDSVKGTTEVFGIIGNPVSHSFSPILQATIGHALGHDMVYVPFPVEKGQVKKAVEGGYALGISGFNITVPHKKEVMESLCEVDETARQIGAVNTLKRTENGYKGFNTDILGLLKCFESRRIPLQGKNVVILGAGGAANAAVLLAAKEAAEKITIVNRTEAHAKALADRVSTFFDVPIEIKGYDNLQRLTGADIVIQTTSLGMDKTAGQSPVSDTGFFEGTGFALDIIYNPWETQFLKDASRMGVETMNGFDMLFYQGIASYEIWNDCKISESLLTKLREELTLYYRDMGK